MGAIFFFFKIFNLNHRIVKSKASLLEDHVWMFVLILTRWVDLNFEGIKAYNSWSNYQLSLIGNKGYYLINNRSFVTQLMFFSVFNRDIHNLNTPIQLCNIF